MTKTSTFTAQDDAFLRDFHRLSEFGSTAGGGVDRQAASVADGEQRAWLKAQLEGQGFDVFYDRIGNQFATLTLVPEQSYVLVGSHLDSQPLAGRYDGAYGVVAAAHAAFRLAKDWSERKITPKYNLAVVNWFNEEGSRFKPSMMGSSVFTGKLQLEDTLDITDGNSIRVKDALDAIGCRTATDAPKPAFYAEIHVEQGRVMEKSGVTIGLVDSNWAANKYEFVVLGEQSHTGSTVMEDRKDAMLGAALIIIAAREISDHFTKVPLHSSVGQVNVLPNSPVVVARKVNLLLDLRSADEEVLAEADQMLHARIAEIEIRANVKIEMAASHSWPVTPYQVEGVELARSIAASLDLKHANMATLAGHDSTNMKDIVPTVMLFVPSVNGIAHNEREYTLDEDIVAGVQMLTEVVQQLCQGALKQVDQAHV